MWAAVGYMAKYCLWYKPDVFCFLVAGSACPGDCGAAFGWIVDAAPAAAMEEVFLEEEADSAAGGLSPASSYAFLFS